MKILQTLAVLLLVNFAFAQTQVNTLNDLRLLPTPNLGDVVYVKGHTTRGDGGGGHFIYSDHPFLISNNSLGWVYGHNTEQPVNEYYEDNDGTIIYSRIGNLNGQIRNNGRWIRLYEGYISVRFFGVFGQSENYTQATLRIEKAIKFAYDNGRIQGAPFKGTTVYFPNGSYIVDRIPIRNGVALLGDSMDKTIITAACASCNNPPPPTCPTCVPPYNTPDPDYKAPTSDEASQYLFQLDKGVVQTTISNFNIMGRETIKGCFYLVSRSTDIAGSSGGLWNSTFKNIKVTDFKGHGIYLKGGSTTLPHGYELPCQFNMFENVQVKRINDNSRCLKMEGAVNQQTFTNCRFDGTNAANRRSFNENVEINNINGTYSGGEVESLIPGAYSFINCVFQDSDFGVKIRNGASITFDTCWFESLGIAIQINADGTSKPSKGINIVNNFFANAAGFGTIIADSHNITAAGRVIDINNSQANILNNFVRVSDPTLPFDKLFILANSSLGVNVQGNTFLDNKLSKTAGLLCVTIPISAKLFCNNNKEILVNSSIGTTSSPLGIQEINSGLLATESITVISNGGYIEFQSVSYSANTLPTKNLYLGGRTKLILGPNEVATFIKVDNLGGGAPPTYQLTSIVKLTTP